MAKAPSRETLPEAVYLARERGASSLLIGLPIGAWPETQQAIQQLKELLPPRFARTYTVSEFIEAIYDMSGSDERFRAK